MNILCDFNLRSYSLFTWDFNEHLKKVGVEVEKKLARHRNNNVSSFFTSCICLINIQRFLKLFFRFQWRARIFACFSARTASRSNRRASTAQWDFHRDSTAEHPFGSLPSLLAKIRSRDASQACHHMRKSQFESKNAIRFCKAATQRSWIYRCHYDDNGTIAADRKEIDTFESFTSESGKTNDVQSCHMNKCRTLRL